MSTYEELKGLKIKYLSADTSGDRIQEGELFYNSTDFNLKSFISTSAWHSSGALGTARYKVGSAPNATTTAGIIFSGADNKNNTELYDGIVWTTAPTLNTGRYGAGEATNAPQTAALCFGG